MFILTLPTLLLWRAVQTVWRALEQTGPTLPPYPPTVGWPSSAPRRYRRIDVDR
jgi:hypothetical protein